MAHFKTSRNPHSSRGSEACHISSKKKPKSGKFPQSGAGYCVANFQKLMTKGQLII